MRDLDPAADIPVDEHGIVLQPAEDPIEPVMTRAERRRAMQSERKMVRRTILASIAIVASAGAAARDLVDSLTSDDEVTESCPHIAPQALRYVEQALGFPNGTAFRVEQDAAEGAERVAAYREYVGSSARYRGLTLVDERPYLLELASANSIHEIIQVTNNFMGNYDIHFGLGESIWDGHANSLNVDISTGELRFGLAEFIEQFRFLPIELVKLANVNEYLLVKDNLTEYLARTNTVNGTVKHDFKAFLASPMAAMMHELGHNLDAEICGEHGQSEDEQYLALNNDEFKYGQESDGVSEKIAAWEYGFTEQYGTEDVLEDKATMFETMLWGLDYPLLYGEGRDIARQKYMLLIARLNREIPGILEYWADIRRPTPETVPALAG